MPAVKSHVLRPCSDFSVAHHHIHLGKNERHSDNNLLL
jgi:hypothetical protein